MNQHEKSSKPLQSSDLERIAGISKSTLHYYIKKGLLSEPRRTGKTMAYYSTVHLYELEEIKRLRNLGYPLSYIKDMLDEERKDKNSERIKKEDPSEKREVILTKAVDLFSNNGYHETKISDIAEAAGVGRSTLYLLFDNKQNLFLECADKVIEIMTSDILSKIEKESDPFKQISRTVGEALRSYPHFLDILNCVDYMVAEDPSLREKGRSIYDHVERIMIGQAQLREALNSEFSPFMATRNIHTFASHVAIGVAKNFYSMSLIYEDYSLEEFATYIDTVNEIISGLIKEK